MFRRYAWEENSEHRKIWALAPDEYGERDVHWNLSIEGSTAAKYDLDNVNCILHEKISDILQQIAKGEASQRPLCYRWVTTWVRAWRMYLAVLHTKQAERAKNPKPGKAAKIVKAAWFHWLGRGVMLACCFLVLLDVNDPNNMRVAKSRLLIHVCQIFFVIECSLKILAYSSLYLVSPGHRAEIAFVVSSTALLLLKYFNLYDVVIWLHMHHVMAFVYQHRAKVVLVKFWIVLRTMRDFSGVFFWLILAGAGVISFAAFLWVVLSQGALSSAPFLSTAVSLSQVILVSGWSEVERGGQDYVWTFVAVLAMTLLLALRAILIASVLVKSEREAEEMEAIVARGRVPEKATDLWGKLRYKSKYPPRMTAAQQEHFAARLYACIESCVLDADEILHIAKRARGEPLIFSLKLAHSPLTLADFYFMREELLRAPKECYEISELAISVKLRVAALMDDMNDVRSELDRTINRLQEAISARERRPKLRDKTHTHTTKPKTRKKPRRNSVRINNQPMEDSTPVPLEDSTLVPLEDSTPVPLEDSTLEPLENSTPVPLENSTAVALEDSTPVPLENSTPVSLENSTPVSLENNTPVTLEGGTPVPLEESTPVPLDGGDDIRYGPYILTPRADSALQRLIQSDPIPKSAASPPQEQKQ